MSFCISLRISSKSVHHRQKKMTSCQFSRWWISAQKCFYHNFRKTKPI